MIRQDLKLELAFESLKILPLTYNPQPDIKHFDNERKRHARISVALVSMGINMQTFGNE